MLILESFISQCSKRLAKFRRKDQDTITRFLNDHYEIVKEEIQSEIKTQVPRALSSMYGLMTPQQHEDAYKERMEILEKEHKERIAETKLDKQKSRKAFENYFDAYVEICNSFGAENVVSGFTKERARDRSQNMYESIIDTIREQQDLYNSAIELGAKHLTEVSRLKRKLEEYENPDPVKQS